MRRTKTCIFIQLHVKNVKNNNYLLHLNLINLTIVTREKKIKRKVREERERERIGTDI